LTDESLTALAKRQRECLYDLHPLDKKIQQREIARVLEAS